MSNTVGRSTSNQLREQVERLVEKLDAAIPQGFTQAIKSFLTALDYHDPALMRSHLNAALEAHRDVVHEAIQKRLGWPQIVRDRCRDLLKLIKDCPRENFDELGDELRSAFDNMLKYLTDLRDGPVKLLQERGFEVENTAQLDSDIRELQELKENILENWPWSDRELPPVDRRMVAESRAAFQRGEGEDIRDLIRRLGGQPRQGKQE